MKRKRPAKTCHKVEYHSVEAARVALRELKPRGVRRFYRCKHHGNRAVWHLTSE